MVESPKREFQELGQVRLGEVYIKRYRHILQSLRGFSEHPMVNTVIVFRSSAMQRAIFRDSVLLAFDSRQS